MSNYKHWKIENDTNNTVWLHLDKADAHANVLSSEVLHEFSSILD